MESQAKIGVARIRASCYPISIQSTTARDNLLGRAEEEISRIRSSSCTEESNANYAILFDFMVGSPFTDACSSIAVYLAMRFVS